MELIPLGSTSLKASRLCLGFEGVKVKQIPPLLREAVALGVNWLDFSSEEQETAVRAILHEQQRDGLVLSIHTTAHGQQELHQDVQQHLAALQVDCVEILFLDEVNELTELAAREDAITAMLEVKSQGAVRALGLQTHNPEVMRRSGADYRFEVLMASMDDRSYSKANAQPQIDAAIHVAHNRGHAVVVSDLIAGRAGHFDPLGILEWAVNVPYVQSLRFSPSSTKELQALVQFIAIRRAELQELEFLWSRAA